MRKILLLLFLTLSGGMVPLYGQLGIGIRFNRMTYMSYEPIHAVVTLRNDTGKPLVFGTDPRLQGFILFDVRDSRNRVVEKIANAEIAVTNLVLRPGETKPLFFQVNKFYRMSKPGNYMVRAYISHPYLGDDYYSPPVPVRVEGGTTIWSQTVGLPDLDGKGKKEQRTYSLKSLYDGSIRYFYLVVEDPTHILGVMRIGRAVGQEKIQIEIDLLSRIHLLIPITPSVFHYLSFSLDGTTTVNSYLKNSNTIPTLIRDSTGNVRVAGGETALAGVDYKTSDSMRKNAMQLTEEYEKQYREDVANGIAGAKGNSGLVDLGKGYQE